MSINRALVWLASGLLLTGTLLWFGPTRELPHLHGPTEATEIHLEGPAGNLDFHHEGKRWLLEGRLADPQRIERLTQLPRMRIQADLGHPQNLAEFGLVPPWGRLRFDAWELVIGQNEPISHRRYLRLPDGRVVLVSDRFSDLLRLPVRAWTQPCPNCPR